MIDPPTAAAASDDPNLLGAVSEPFSALLPHLLEVTAGPEAATLVDVPLYVSMSVSDDDDDRELFITTELAEALADARGRLTDHAFELADEVRESDGIERLMAQTKLAATEAALEEIAHRVARLDQDGAE